MFALTITWLLILKGLKCPFFPRENISQDNFTTLLRWFTLKIQGKIKLPLTALIICFHSEVFFLFPCEFWSSLSELGSVKRYFPRILNLHFRNRDQAEGSVSLSFGYGFRPLEFSIAATSDGHGEANAPCFTWPKPPWGPRLAAQWAPAASQPGSPRARASCPPPPRTRTRRTSHRSWSGNLGGKTASQHRATAGKQPQTSLSYEWCIKQGLVMLVISQNTAKNISRKLTYRVYYVCT